LDGAVASGARVGLEQAAKRVVIAARRQARVVRVVIAELGGIGAASIAG
jgi:hypothetical protein